jgi:hypothetical protein
MANESAGNEDPTNPAAHGAEGGEPFPDLGELRSKFIAYVEEKWVAPSKECPICTSNSWNATLPYEVRPLGSSALASLGGGPVFPLILLVCNVCGFVHQFSAIATGILPRRTPPNPTLEVHPK